MAVVETSLNFMNQVATVVSRNHDHGLVTIIREAMSENILDDFAWGENEARFIVSGVHSKDDIEENVETLAEKIAKVFHSFSRTAPSLDDVNSVLAERLIQASDIFGAIL